MIRSLVKTICDETLPTDPKKALHVSLNFVFILGVKPKKVRQVICPIPRLKKGLYKTHWVDLKKNLNHWVIRILTSTTPRDHFCWYLARKMSFLVPTLRRSTLARLRWHGVNFRSQRLGRMVRFFSSSDPEDKDIGSDAVLTCADIFFSFRFVLFL